MEEKIYDVNLSEVEKKYVGGWSGAGFFVPWLFLFVNKQNKLAWKILALFIFTTFLELIPYLGITIPGLSFSMLNNLNFLNLLYFALAIWISIKGREMAWNSKKFSSFEEFKTKQSVAIKFVTIFVVIYAILSVTLYINLASQYVKNPELLNDQVYGQAINDAKTRSSTIDETEFKKGYDIGLTEGDITKTTTNSLLTNQNNSYKMGYQYGFIISCAKVGDQTTCTKKLLSSGAMR